MVLFFEIAMVVILVITLVYGIKYIMLLVVKYEADKDFKNLFKALSNQYKAVNTLLPILSALSPESSSIIEDTKNLISKAVDFSIEKDGNERIIAYANSILENADIVLNSISETNTENADIKEYVKILNGFEKYKDKYNKSAQRLRHYADVFPTSFFARLKRITIMDYMK